MKNLRLLSLAAILVTATSCLKDTDSTPQYYGIGTVQDTASGFLVMTDDDELLYGTSTTTTAKFEAGQRIYFFCSNIKDGAESDGYDKLVTWDDIIGITTKDILVLNKTSRDTIGDDPVNVSNVWIAGKFINAEFRFWGYNKKHYVDLVYDSLAQTLGDTIVLELRHDAHNDVAADPYNGLFCFDLTSINWPATPPYTIQFRNTNYDSVDKVVNVTYTPPTE